MTAISDDATVIQLNAKKRFIKEFEEPGAQILILSIDESNRLPTRIE